MLNFKDFCNENKSAFDDIQYRDHKGRSMFNTNDDFTIDFIHMINPYFTGHEEALERYLIKFNQFYKTDISIDQLKNVLPYLEDYWNDDSDLTLKILLFFINNPDKIEDYFKSKDVINKFQL